MTDYDLGPLTKRARSAAFMANDDAGGNKAVNEALIQLRIAIVKAYAGASDAQFIPGKPCACTGPNPGDAECPCLMQWKGLTPTLMMDTPKIVWHSAANGLQEEFAKIKLAKPFLHNIFQPTRPNDPLSVLGALEATVNARTEDTTKLLDAMRNALITAADEQTLLQARLDAMTARAEDAAARPGRAKLAAQVQRQAMIIKAKEAAISAGMTENAKLRAEVAIAVAAERKACFEAVIKAKVYVESGAEFGAAKRMMDAALAAIKARQSGNLK